MSARLPAHRAQIRHEMTTTTFALDGYVTVQTLGVVMGITVRSRSIFGTMWAGLQTIRGGNIEMFTELCNKARLEAFELMREVSPKNDYRFALTMEFADRSAYETYNEHQAHVQFVSERWMNEVSDFLELDSEAL